MTLLSAEETVGTLPKHGTGCTYPQWLDWRAVEWSASHNPATWTNAGLHSVRL